MLAIQLQSSKPRIRKVRNGTQKMRQADRPSIRIDIANLPQSDTPMCFRYETFIRQLNKPRSSGRLIDTHSINGWLSYAAFLVLLAATTWALGVARSLVGSDGSVN